MYIDCNVKAQREAVRNAVIMAVGKMKEKNLDTTEIKIELLEHIDAVIERLEEIVEEQEERIAIMSEGGWIPISRLPEDESDVLLYGEGKGIVIAYYSDGVWYDYQHNHLRNRTHWIPLPEPPKEGDPG